MRRSIAVLLLLLFTSFLAMTGQDRCHENRMQADQPHVLCVDDCAPAVIPAPPVPPPADPLPRLQRQARLVLPILERDLEPEKAPPRS